MFIITFPLNKKFVFYLTIPKNRNSNQEAIRLLLLLLNPECEKCEKRISLAAISSDCVKIEVGVFCLPDNECGYLFWSKISLPSIDIILK